MRKLKILKKHMEFNAELYNNAFCENVDSKCALVARDEQRLAETKEKFIEAVGRKTGAHIVRIDMAQMAAEGKTPKQAVIEALHALAKREGISLVEANGDAKDIDTVYRDLCTERIGNTVPTPLVCIDHFQCCTKTVSLQNRAPYVFLRTLKCRLLLSANMDIVDIDSFFVPPGEESILSPQCETLSIEGDVPYGVHQIDEACAVVMGKK